MTRHPHALAAWLLSLLGMVLDEKPCDAPGVSVHLKLFRDRWRWDLKCLGGRHGTLRIGGLIDDWEPTEVTRFRLAHAACAAPDATQDGAA